MVHIKYSCKEDLEKIAKCHILAFPRSLSSKMGLKYLKKMIGWYLTDENKFLFHLEDNNKCVGYCAGLINDGTLPTGSASGMIQHTFNEAIIALLFRPWLIFHKEILSKHKLIIRNVRRRFNKTPVSKKTAENSITKVQKKVAGLVVIGVSEEYQGHGYGSMLLKEFENKVKKLNLKEMALTVRSNNEPAIRAYEKNGWVKSSLQNNTLEMIKELY